MDEFNGIREEAMKKYGEYRVEIEKKLYKSVNRDIKIFIEFSVVLVIGILIASAFTTTNEFAITMAFRNVFAMIGIYIIIICVLILLNCVRHILRYKKIYVADFRRIQEKLSYDNIYMKIPDEDIHKYDNLLKLVKDSWKNREKNT